MKRPPIDAALLIAIRADGALHSAGEWRRRRGLGHDVDDAADGAVAIETAPLLPRVISMRSMLLSGIAEKSKPCRIQILKAPAVHQDEDVRLREGAETAQIDHVIDASRAAEQVHDLHAGRLRQNIRQRLTRRTLDILCRDHRARSAGDAAAETRRADIDGRQLDGILRARGVREQCQRQARRRAGRIFFPMTQRSFVCARANGGASGETKPGAKDAKRRNATTRAAHMLECRGRNVSHGHRTGIVVTAAKDRSVWTPRPPVG